MALINYQLFLSHSLVISRNWLHDDGPLNGNDGSIGDDIMIKIDHLTNGGYAIGTVGQTGEMASIVALI